MLLQESHCINSLKEHVNYAVVSVSRSTTSCKTTVTKLKLKVNVPATVLEKDQIFFIWGLGKNTE